MSEELEQELKQSTTSKDNEEETFPEGVPVLDSGKGPTPPPEDPELLIITGMSGAGRSLAGIALEDLGWYVVDNLPPRMLPALAGMMTPNGEGVHLLAAVVDVRSKQYFAELEGVLQELAQMGIAYRILFLEADSARLVRRFEANRRPHPLQGDGRIVDALMAERRLLEPLRRQADFILDTTNLSNPELSRRIHDILGKHRERPLHLNVMSFGFKYGLPLDADIVVDMRFLSNPYWVTELRHLNGRDKAVSDFVLALPGAKEFLDGWAELYAPVLNRYLAELKPYVTIAVGCTGGKHRSVASAEYLSNALREHGYLVKTLHRDLGKE
ncbi:RNase adaptor protein RapZ [Boudabousia tangfeifanii]|uniref:RNase adaptor protein RapZ n=1 Tax=Boudabousia tangfeifanii TaxID=1912795 RepID=A0A1D9MJY1_9ACTO|nr:RNase adapter RapZ [Boudabousia tangfeifanii]AOZ72592.1 RNase adaptor protein RapZ [Boudabousia tangfeifanii]